MGSKRAPRAPVGGISERTVGASISFGVVPGEAPVTTREGACPPTNSTPIIFCSAPGESSEILSPSAAFPSLPGEPPSGSRLNQENQIEICHP